MAYIFSEQQIDRAHHLLAFHNMDAEQIADIMGTSIVTARHLIKMAKRKYAPPKHKIKPAVPKKYCLDATGFNEVPKHVPGKKNSFVRPKAEYSNKRFYDLI